MLAKFTLATIATAFAVATHAAPCDSPVPIDLSSLQAELGKRQVVFVASDLGGNCWATDAVRAAERKTPWSTFKIPHTLIALETRAVSGAQEVIDWSPRRHPAQPYWPKDWAQPQTLASAFERSTAWYFQELVPRIGATAYTRTLARLRYGSAAVAAGNTAFWLDGTLKVSPIEQVEFLGCLARHGCGFSARSVSVFESVALDEDASGSRMFGKTGSGPQRPGDMDGPFEGWYVGYVRDAGGRATAAFALFATSPTFQEIRTFRRSFAKVLLARLGLWHP